MALLPVKIKWSNHYTGNTDAQWADGAGGAVDGLRRRAALFSSCHLISRGQFILMILRHDIARRGPRRSGERRLLLWRWWSAEAAGHTRQTARRDWARRHPAFEARAPWPRQCHRSGRPPQIQIGVAQDSIDLDRAGGDARTVEE